MDAGKEGDGLENVVFAEKHGHTGQAPKLEAFGAEAKLGGAPARGIVGDGDLAELLTSDGGGVSFGFGS